MLSKANRPKSDKVMSRLEFAEKGKESESKKDILNEVTLNLKYKIPTKKNKKRIRKRQVHANFTPYTSHYEYNITNYIDLIQKIT